MHKVLTVLEANNAVVAILAKCPASSSFFSTFVIIFVDSVVVL